MERLIARIVTTMKLDGDELPVLLVGATYFHATRTGWLEVAYFFDPFANDVREGGPSAAGSRRSA